MKPLSSQRLLLVFLGLFLLIIGVLGFRAGNNAVLGIFHVNATINIIHIITALICFHSALTDSIIPEYYWGNPVFRMKGNKSVRVVFLNSENFVFGFAVIYGLLGFGELIHALVDWIRHTSLAVPIFAIGALHIFLVLFTSGLNSLLEKDLNN